MGERINRLLERLNLRTSDGRFDWNQFWDGVTEPWVPGDYWNAGEQRRNSFLEVSGLDGLANWFNRNPPGFTPEPGMGIMPTGPNTPGNGTPFVDFNPRYPWEQLLETMEGVESGPERRLYGDGEGMMRDPNQRNPFAPGTRIGAGNRSQAPGSTVVATGEQAQNMFEGMRNAQRDQSAAARQAMMMMFGGKER